MKKISILFLFLLAGGLTFAQGIKFEHISYEQALDKAKKQDKLIFIDFYTQWCGPCKALVKGAFLDPDVGSFYNTNFINLKCDAEKEGKETAQKYAVYRYPTLMFINKEGKMVYCIAGGNKNNKDRLINEGKEAIALSDNDTNLLSLQKQFHEKQNDEQFLKDYYLKIIEYGANATEGIEAWLKIQTELDESSIEMMNFLLKYWKYLFIDGKAEEILKANYNKYTTYELNFSEKSRLKNLESDLLNNTLKKAQKRQDPQLMRAFITNLKEIPKNTYKSYNLALYEMEYMHMVNDAKGYKKAAINYIDSLINLKPVKQVHEEHKRAYEAFKRSKPDTSHFMLKTKMILMEKGLWISGRQIRRVDDLAHKYLSFCTNEKDFKHLRRWINYCYELTPGNYYTENLNANMLYKQEEIEEAIELKKSAIEKTPKTAKKYTNIQYELKLMQQGEKLFSKP